MRKVSKGNVTIKVCFADCRLLVQLAVGSWSRNHYKTLARAICKLARVCRTPWKFEVARLCATHLLQANDSRSSEHIGNVVTEQRHFFLSSSGTLEGNRGSGACGSDTAEE